MSAAAPRGAVRKRGMKDLLSESEFPPLDTGQRNKRNRSLFIFGRGEENIGPRFMKIERTDEGQMKALSAFKVKREIAKIAGKVKRIQPLMQGKFLLVEIMDENQAIPLLKLELLAGKPVKISWHETMNKSKGVIACFDWTHIPMEELKEELKAFNISDIIAIKRKVAAGQMVDTGSFIVTFDSPHLPDSIDAFYYPLKVKMYVPNPLRCFKCQKYGHFIEKCRLPTKRCGKCLYDEHEGECKHPHFCANCGDGGHYSWSRKCPIFKQEFEIMKIKVTRKISYFLAQEEYRKSRNMDQSFAAVVAKTNATKVLKTIQASKRITFPGYEQDKSTVDNRNGVGLPSSEFLNSLREDRMETDGNNPAECPPGPSVPPGVSTGDTTLGACNSTGNVQNPPFGTIIKNALDTLT